MNCHSKNTTVKPSYLETVVKIKPVAIFNACSICAQQFSTQSLDSATGFAPKGAFPSHQSTQRQTVNTARLIR